MGEGGKVMGETEGAEEAEAEGDGRGGGGGGGDGGGAGRGGGGPSSPRASSVCSSFNACASSLASISLTRLVAFGVRLLGLSGLGSFAARKLFSEYIYS
jgi:hypothetical protein